MFKDHATAIRKKIGPVSAVAASPETVKKFITMGFGVIVEKGAGSGASMADAAYVEAGALATDGAEARCCWIS